MFWWLNIILKPVLAAAVQHEDSGIFCLTLKVIYHPLYGMNNYVLIWGDWLSCDPL